MDANPLREDNSQFWAPDVAITIAYHLSPKTTLSNLIKKVHAAFPINVPVFSNRRMCERMPRLEASLPRLTQLNKIFPVWIELQASCLWARYYPAYAPGITTPMSQVLPRLWARYYPAYEPGITLPLISSAVMYGWTDVRSNGVQTTLLTVDRVTIF